MKKSFLLAIIMIAGVGVCANTIIPLNDIAVQLKSSYRGRGAVKATSEYNKDKDSVTCKYDFTACPDARNSFFKMRAYNQLPGMPLAVTCDAKNLSGTIGGNIRIWFNDCTGECYMSSLPINWKGEKNLQFKVPSHPIWKSGDKNRKIDLPLRICGISVEMSGKGQKGKIQLSNFKLKTDLSKGCPFTIKVTGERYYWGAAKPFINIMLTNYAKRSLDPITAEITPFNRYTKKKLASVKVAFKAGNDINTVAKGQLSIPYGSYNVTVRLLDGNNCINTIKHRIQYFSTDCSKASKELLNYEMHWSPVGGVWGNMTPKFANKFGVRWQRFEHPNWRNTEIERGVYDATKIIAAAKSLRDSYVRPITLQTIYHYPKFRSPADICDFALGYGKYHKYMAKILKKYVNDFELGNEDNGHSKFIYTEIARNAAAGIRSVRPFGIIANSGTAFVDDGWLRMQMNRGLLEYIDALCVHPYTNNSTPSQKVSAENCGVLNKLENLNSIVDAAGGMKELWSTEFGWPNRGEDLEKDRAEIYLREMAVMDIAGLSISGLYTFKRDYGTVDHPAGIAINTYAVLLAGHRVAGYFINKNNIWTVVYEKSGKATAMVWTPENKSLDLNISGKEYYDLFGNKIPGNSKVSQSPIYVVGLNHKYIKKAVEESCKRKKEFFIQCRKRYPKVSAGNTLVKIKPVNFPKLKKELMRWTKCNGNISKGEKAVIGRILDWYICAGRLLNQKASSISVSELEQSKKSLQEKIKEVNNNDGDLSGLRYLLRCWNRVSAERKLARGNKSYINSCLSQEDVIAHVGKRFARDERPFMYSVFTTLYMKKVNKLTEMLTFVAGKPGIVKARVTSYSSKKHKVTVIPKIPSGWKCEPAKAKVKVGGDSSIFVNFKITPARKHSNEHKKIRVITSIPGLPESSAWFDEIDVVPALKVDIQPIKKNISKFPVTIDIENQEKATLSGKVRFVVPGLSGKAIAEYKFDKLMPYKKITAKVKFHKVPEKLKENWILNTEVNLSDGRRFNIPVKIDFVRAQKAKSPVKIDSDLSDWKDALPLKLNRAEYTRGSYGGGWSPDNCSAITYLKWDADNLYFAAKVRDQTFNQLFDRDSMWKQDSIQIIFASDINSKYQELTMALSPSGPKIWTTGGYMNEAQISVEYRNRTIFYEAAIPWKAFKGKLRNMVKKGNFRYAVAINDDDAISSRCFLERFEGSIVHGKKVASFAEAELATNTIDFAKDNGEVFFEDFNNDKSHKQPQAWHYLRNRLPANSNHVESQCGIDNSNALLLINKIGPKPHHFAIVYYPLENLKPNKKYRLTFKVKGSVASPNGIVGFCADKWGNKSQRYASWKPSADWQDVSMNFRAHSGKMNIIIRNIRKTDGLLIDNIKITEIKK